MNSLIFCARRLGVGYRCSQKRALVSVSGLCILALLLTPSIASAEPLPDGRAWEMVSPLDKNSSDIVSIEGDGGGGVVQASVDGERVTYVSLAAFADPQGAQIGNQYVSSRSSGGWLIQNIDTPTNAQTYPTVGGGAPYKAFSTGLSRGLLSNGMTRGNHPVENPPLAPGAPAGYQNYYLVGIPAFPEPGPVNLQALLTETPDEPPATFRFRLLDATPDINHIVVETSTALVPPASAEPNLYEWTDSAEPLRAVNVLPNGTAEPGLGLKLGSILGQNRTISGDGSRVVWSDGPHLYVRYGLGTSQAGTVQVDEKRGGLGPGGGGVFLTASSDLSKVFFADSHRLTNDSTAVDGGGVAGLGDLYEFEVGEAGGGRLTDLTKDLDVGGAGMLGVLGASEDGSYVYFVANGVLEGAPPGIPAGTCEPGFSQSQTQTKRCNLYMWHNGTTRFIATLSGADQSGSGHNGLGVAFDWDPRTILRTARVTPDGRHLLFMSERSLTDYDNTVRTGESCAKTANNIPLSAQCEEVFRYDAGTGGLSCISCNPSGARPIGPSGIPGGTPFEVPIALYQSRVLSEDGSRVFFDTTDALVPQDTNGREDVYEYEDGRAYLLSGGESPQGASFVDASADGSDAFFVTRARLVGQDTDQLKDLYDARAPRNLGEAVGFPVPTSPVVCGGEDCRTAGQPRPALGAPGSATFNGAGNLTPPTPAPVTPKPLTRAQKLAKALKVCRTKHGRHKRSACEAHARKRYSPPHRPKQSTRRAGR